MKLITLCFTFCVFGLGQQAQAFSCPLTKEAKSLVEEAVKRNTSEARWILNNSRPAERFASRGFARSFIGRSESSLGSLTLAESCEGPATYEEYCEEVGEEGMEKCMQLGCLAAGLDTIKLWYQPAPLFYMTDASELPKFNVVYRKKPETYLIYDWRAAGQLKIGWTAVDMVVARPHGMPSLSASSSLVGTGVTTKAGPQSGEVHIDYPKLARRKGLTHLHIQLNSHGEATGKILFRKGAIAEISPATSHDEVAKIKWLPSCSE